MTKPELKPIQPKKVLETESPYKNETIIKEKKNKIISKDDKGRVRVRTKNMQNTRTHQEFKDEVNVNSIIRKYQRTGMLTHVRENPGVYMDLTDIGDYQEAAQKVVDANTTFNSLSSELRKKFNNDPQNLINYLEDPKNLDEAQELGLVSLSRDKIPPKTSTKPPEAPKKADPTPSPSEKKD